MNHFPKSGQTVSPGQAQNEKDPPWTMLAIKTENEMGKKKINVLKIFQILLPQDLEVTSWSYISTNSKEP